MKAHGLFGSLFCALFVFSQIAAAEVVPEIAKKYECEACHAIDTKVIGPPWRSVAMKYRGEVLYVYAGKSYPLLEGLMKKVSHGGHGVWGGMPMVGRDPRGEHQEDIKEMVLFVLSLAKKD